VATVGREWDIHNEAISAIFATMSLLQIPLQKNRIIYGKQEVLDYR
jgi:hypothetical protein